MKVLSMGGYRTHSDTGTGTVPSPPAGGGGGGGERGGGGAGRLGGGGDMVVLADMGFSNPCLKRPRFVEVAILVEGGVTTLLGDCPAPASASV